MPLNWHPPGLLHPRVINVVATGSHSIEGRGLHPIAILIDSDIRALQGPDITRVLRRLPGVALTRNGGAGGFTGLSVRGGASEDVLVLVDGVRVADAASPGGGLDFGSLTSGELGKVELLRGPHSVIWGADAIAGVMAISSRVPGRLDAAAEFGGPRSFSANAAWGVAGQGRTLAISGGFTDARGISAAEEGNERDGLAQWNIGARGDLRVTGTLKLLASARFSDTRAGIDGFPAPDYILADTFERQDTQRWLGSAGLEWTPGSSNFGATISQSRTSRDLVDEALSDAAYFSSTGESRQASAKASTPITDKLSAHLGVDWMQDSYRSHDAFARNRAEAETRSAHALLSYAADVRFSAGLRRDDHSGFGSEWSLGAAGMVRLSGNLDLRASYGEGFKAPSLFQLLSEYGNASLQPERARALDLGLTWEPERRSSISLSLFRRDARDLIGFTSCFGTTSGICANRPFGTYDNLARARAQGFEVEGEILFGQAYNRDLFVQANWSYLATSNRTAGAANFGNRLPRRPRHTVNISADWAMGQGLFDPSLGVDFHFASASFDDPANTRRLGAYALVDVRMSWPLVEVGPNQRTIDLTARVENLRGAQYQTAAGYAAMGRAAYLGFRVRL